MKFDVIIIGAGPAGLTAGIFVARAGLKVAIFEGLGIGGQCALSYDIANYPGFNSISGFDLADKMREQAELNGSKIINEKVKKLRKDKNKFLVETSSSQYTANSVIIATGGKVKKLGLESEQELTGRGVSYCASCDGGFYKNKVVAVVGGGYTAMEDVTYLLNLCEKVYLINRSEQFRADEKTVKALKKHKKVEFITSANVVKLNGREHLTSINIKQGENEREIMCDGLFIAIGSEPDTAFVDFEVARDEKGYLIVDEDMRTNVDGLYACGDVIKKKFRQVITACNDGAIAGNCVIGDKNEKK